MQRLDLLSMWDRWRRDIEFYRSYKVCTSKSGSLNGCVLVSTAPIYFTIKIMVLLGTTFLVLFAWLLLLMCYFPVAYFVSACQGNITDVVLCSYDDHFLVSSKFLFIWIFFYWRPSNRGRGVDGFMFVCIFNVWKTIRWLQLK